MEKEDDKPDYATSYTGLVPVILKKVEELYGPRVGEVNFEQIVYEGVVRPELDYEEFMFAMPPVKDKVNIAMTPDTRGNYNKGIFQLSHEVVHLLATLSFDEDQYATNLEEGLAVYFSEDYTRTETGDVANFNAPTKSTGYRFAYDLVKQLLDHYPDAIRKLREQQPWFNKITIGDFKNAGIDLYQALIAQLLAIFVEVLEKKPEKSNDV